MICPQCLEEYEEKGTRLISSHKCGKVTERKPQNHIHTIGFSEGADEAWLVYADNPNDSFIEIKFTYCPMCGEKL